MAISVNDAQKLVNILRSHLTLAEDALQELIEEKAWEPLGYSSFRAMWQAELADVVELTSLTRAVILYELIDEANEELGHADRLLGVDKGFIDAVKDAHSRGLTSGQAAVHGDAVTVVRQHTRKPRGTQSRVSVSGLSPSELDYFKVMAKKFGMKQSELWTEGFRTGVNQVIAERLEGDVA